MGVFFQPFRFQILLPLTHHSKIMEYPFWLLLFFSVFLVSDLIKMCLVSKTDQGNKHNRNIWDYSLLPGLSQALHNTPWQFSLLASFLLLFLVLYLFSENAIFLKMFEANFFLLVGSLLKINWNTKNQKEDSTGLKNQ